jgi:hypothetical protein
VQHLARSPRIGLGCQNIPVLSISPATSDHADLEALLFTPQWKVHRAVSLPSALSQLRHLRPIPVVVCERNLVQVTWQEVLMETVLLREPPCFIITSRFADDYLWADSRGQLGLAAQRISAPNHPHAVDCLEGRGRLETMTAPHTRGSL